jgi:hypothetical protein
MHTDRVKAAEWCPVVSPYVARIPGLVSGEHSGGKAPGGGFDPLRLHFARSPNNTSRIGALRRQRHCPLPIQRTRKRTRKLSKNREVGMKPHALDFAHPERRESPFVLAAAEERSAAARRAARARWEPKT